MGDDERSVVSSFGGGEWVDVFGVVEGVGVCVLGERGGEVFGSVGAWGLYEHTEWGRGEGCEEQQWRQVEV